MGDVLAGLALAAVLVPALGFGLIALAWGAAAETRHADHRKRGGWRYGPPPATRRGLASPLARCASWGPPAPPRTHAPELPEASPPALPPAPTTWAPYGGEL